MTLHPGWPAVSGAATFQNIRRDISGTVVKSAANVIRKGILPITTTALVTGTATMNVAVGAFYAVLDRNGVVYVHNDGSVNVLLSSAPGSGSRWSVVYVKQRESESPFSDGATGPVLDKVESVTSEAAARALLPAGALELAVVKVDAGSANTNAVGVTITQTVLYTAMEGGDVLLRNATEQTAWAPHDGSRAYRLDLAGYVSMVSGAWELDDSGWVTLTVSSGWLANNPPPRIRRQGKTVTLNGVLAYNASGSFNSLFTIPAGYIPASVSGGTISYIGQANMRVGGGAGTGFTGPLVVTIATGVVQLDLGYSTGSATPTFVTLNGTWVLG